MARVFGFWHGVSLCYSMKAKIHIFTYEVKQAEFDTMTISGEVAVIGYEDNAELKALFKVYDTLKIAADRIILTPKN